MKNLLHKFIHEVETPDHLDQCAITWQDIEDVVQHMIAIGFTPYVDDNGEFEADGWSDSLLDSLQNVLNFESLIASIVTKELKKRQEL